MSTDNEMDDLLRNAGSRWRDANPADASSVDFHAVAAPEAPPRRSRWLVAAAAAVLVAGVAVGGTWLGTHHTHDNTQSVGKGDGTEEPTTWGGLTGTDWKIFEVTTETSMSSNSTGVEGSKASLHIQSDGTFTGSDGCAPISGTVQISATTLTFADVAVAAIGCLANDVTATAAKIDAILQGQVTWSIGDAGGANDLSIEHPGVGSLIYFGDKPASPPVTDPSAVAGTWELTSYEQTDKNGSSGGGGGSAAGAGGTNGFGDLLVIDGDGTFKAQHRCYANAGTVLFGDGKATWSGVHLAGSIPCPSIPDEQQDEQERNAVVDAVLKGETTWKIDNGQLTITNGGDSVTFSPYANDATSSGAPTK